jgi:murein L,D-transpeptidase YafK
MTNKETIERNIGLTFDFVNHLIDHKADLEKLPDNFTIEFVEKDFSKLQRKHNTNQATPTVRKKFVQVKNSFVTI